MYTFTLGPCVGEIRLVLRLGGCCTFKSTAASSNVNYLPGQSGVLCRELAMSREPVTVAPAKPTAARDTSCQINTVGAHWVRSLAMTFASSAAKAIGASDCSAPNGRGGQWDAPATGQISWSQMRGRRVERPLDRGPDEPPPWALGPGPLGGRPPAAPVQLAVEVHRRGSGCGRLVLFDRVSFYIGSGARSSTSCVFCFPLELRGSLSALFSVACSLLLNRRLLPPHACIPCNYTLYVAFPSRYPAISHCGPFHRRLQSAARTMTGRRAEMDLRSLYAGSPRSLSNGARTKTDQRQRQHPIPDNSYPESMTCSVSTLSSHSASPAPSLDGSRSPVFDAADYSDPSFVSADTMSNTVAVLGPPYQYTSEKVSEARNTQPQLSEGRPQSLGLPLRVHDEGTEPGTKKTLKRSTTHPVRASSVSVRKAANRAFE